MAKELPYFKFEPNQWENGNIQFYNRAVKGLFIDLCSMYWSRLGELDYALALQKLCNGDSSELDLLMQRDIFLIEDDKIVIEFLDEQLNDFQETNIKRRYAANKRWGNKEINANALQKQSKSNAIRGEKIRKEKMKEDDIEKENIYNDIEALKIHYLSKDKVLNAVVNNKENKTNSIDDLKIKLDLFCNDLTEQGRLSLTWKEFSSYFRNCLKYGRFEDAKNKVIDNPNNEEIIKFNSNVNPTIFELPKSKFLELQEQNKSGGYIYNII